MVEKQPQQNYWFRAIVLTNTILEIFHQIPDFDYIIGTWRYPIQILCIWFFLGEILTRLKKLGWAEFRSSRTNLFELGLSIILLPALVLYPWMPDTPGLNALLATSLLKAGVLTKNSKKLREARTWLKPVRDNLKKAAQTASVFLLISVTASISSWIILNEWIQTTNPEVGTTAIAHPSLWGSIGFCILAWTITTTALTIFGIHAHRHEMIENLIRDLHVDTIRQHDELIQKLEANKEPSQSPEEAKEQEQK